MQKNKMGIIVKYGEVPEGLAHKRREFAKTKREVILEKIKEIPLPINSLKLKERIGETNINNKTWHRYISKLAKDNYIDIEINIGGVNGTQTIVTSIR